jgi:hypothetical protein
MTHDDRRPPMIPWGTEALARWAVWTVGCGVGLIVVWWEVAGRGVFSAQVGWLSAGIGALMVSLYGHMSLVVRGRRAVGERRSSLISDGVIELLPAFESVAVRERSEHSKQSIHTVVVVVNGSALYHDPSCPMTTGREVSAMMRAESVAVGLDGCGICCRPEVLVSAAERGGPAQ